VGSFRWSENLDHNNGPEPPAVQYRGDLGGVQHLGQRVRRADQRHRRLPRRRVANPRGTGLRSTSLHNTSHPNNPDTDDNRRLIVRADKPASPSDNRTTLPSPRGKR
jgi:hypothetical protein